MLNISLPERFLTESFPCFAQTMRGQSAVLSLDIEFIQSRRGRGREKIFWLIFHCWTQQRPDVSNDEQTNLHLKNPDISTQLRPHFYIQKMKILDNMKKIIH